MQIRNTKVYGLSESIVRSGYPMSTTIPVHLMYDYIDFIMNVPVEEKDKKRASTLSKYGPGKGDANFLKGIIVQFDIKYTMYWSMQAQRYHWFDIVSSMSKMHTITKRELTTGDFNDYVDVDIIERVNKYIRWYNDTDGKELPGHKYELFMRIISNMPSGYETWMGITTNYLQLKTIYHQRKNHKLKDDWGYFCKWVEGLPNSGFIVNLKE